MKLAVTLITLFLLFPYVHADDYALDDAHNHDGTHVEGQSDCGVNYMMPGETARMGSHSFLILGEDGPQHLLLDHRSGTPPHTYHFLIRVRVDENEMATYRKLLKETQISLPAVTTIFFDSSGKQVDRTFFCLQDLKKIFGSEQKSGDAFEILFPIRATWQKNADFEGAFPIEESIVAGPPLIIERKDVELILYRYLPSYLVQSRFRKLLKEKGSPFTSLLSHSPIRQDEPMETAQKRSSYIHSGALESNGETCPSDYYLKDVRPPKTRHAFLLLAEHGKSSVLATHLYDQSPQNYQTTLVFDFTNEQMKTFREARKHSSSPLLFFPTDYFCMAEIKDLVKRKSLSLSGPVYQNTQFEDFELGQKVTDFKISSDQIKVLVSRTLQSLMNPQAVARDVFGFVDIKTVIPNVFVEAIYSTNWNFIGRPIEGYKANKCFLTQQAAKALSAVQKDVARQGYSLLIFDCYRPQRSVTQFIAWTKDAADSKMKTVFYPEEDKAKLIERGYINDRSGHSRGSTIDLTLVQTSIFDSKKFQALAQEIRDCRKPQPLQSAGLIDMGTTVDCFSELANTAHPGVSEQAQKNREILKLAMEKQGFKNYSKEWWHYFLKNDPYKKDFFDFEVQ